MITVFQAIFLGIVQGLTELLPISSSAHLIIIPWMFNWSDLSDSFEVALHFGTLLAIGLFFFKDWIEMIKGGYRLVVKKEKSVPGRMFWYIVFATIPSGVIGFLLDHYLEDALRKPIIIAVSLIVMGIILYYVDKNCESKIKYSKMGPKETFLIGLSQALAFIPGVSRSGVTMTTARLLKVKRQAAARYSFMLSAPIVLAATIFKLPSFQFSLAFFLGVLASFIVGYMVIKFLLQYLQKGSFKVFAIYRVIFGLIIIIVNIIK